MKKRIGDLTLDELAAICNRNKRHCNGCPLCMDDDCELCLLDIAPDQIPMDKYLEVPNNG